MGVCSRRVLKWLRFMRRLPTLSRFAKVDVEGSNPSSRRGIAAALTAGAVRSARHDTARPGCSIALSPWPRDCLVSELRHGSEVRMDAPSAATLIQRTETIQKCNSRLRTPPRTSAHSPMHAMKNNGNQGED